MGLRSELGPQILDEIVPATSGHKEQRYNCITIKALNNQSPNRINFAYYCVILPSDPCRGIFLSHPNAQQHVSSSKMNGKKISCLDSHTYVIYNYLFHPLICLYLCRHNTKWQCNFPLKITKEWLRESHTLPLPSPFCKCVLGCTKIPALWNKHVNVFHQCIWTDFHVPFAVFRYPFAA